MLKPMLIAQIKMVAVSVAVLAISPSAAQGLAGDRDGLLEPNRQRYIPEPEPDPIDLPSFEPEATVHLASYYNDQDAIRGWDILSARHEDALFDYDPILRSVDLGARGEFVRLLAGPVESQEAARRLCARLQRTGSYCAPADLAGALLTPVEDSSR
ncbi:MAG: SPOR domain-containing protein [Pseudomonadota bacterium]